MGRTRTFAPGTLPPIIRLFLPVEQPVTVSEPPRRVASPLLSSLEGDSELESVYDTLNRPRPLLVVISGPSGVGKDAVLQALKLQEFPFYFVVTATTRARRPNEIDGRDYHFVSVGEFAEMIEQGELLEYAVVYGDYKGIPRKHVRAALESGYDVIMRIDVQGAATIRSKVPNAVTIFLTAESEAELVHRLEERKTEEAGQLKMRIVTARSELRRAAEFDYVVVNRDNQLDETVRQLLAIITAEKCRTDWRPVVI
jgi:guanylate kinase